MRLRTIGVDEGIGLVGKQHEPLRTCMQWNVIAVLRLGDFLDLPFLGVDNNRKAADALDHLDVDATDVPILRKVRNRRLQHLVVGEIGRAEVPHARPDLVMGGLGVDHEKLGLFQLLNRAVRRRPRQSHVAHHVDHAARPRCNQVENCERAFQPLLRFGRANVHSRRLLQSISCRGGLFSPPRRPWCFPHSKSSAACSLFRYRIHYFDNFPAGPDGTQEGGK
jgi:hypothetical protein